MKTSTNERKSRILYLKRYLEECADELHPITITQILSYLEKKGISASRKTVTQDITQLIESGVDIVCNAGHSYEYFIGERHFELPELKLLVDAVAASGFISPTKSAELIEKLMAFSSEHQAIELNRRLHVDKYIKSENKNNYYTVDLLHTAINASKKITFKYYEYDQYKKKVYKHNRHLYTFSPYTLLWNNDRYYAVGFSEKHGKVVSFRVDRIATPMLMDNPAVPIPADFDIQLYTKSIFQMFEGKQLKKITIKCQNELMKSVIDRFGIDVETQTLDKEHFSAVVDVSASPTFYGWVFSFGGRMKITAPVEAVTEYQTLAKRAIE